MTSDHVGILISNTVVEVITGSLPASASLSAGLIRETMNRVVMQKPPLINFVPRFPLTDMPIFLTSEHHVPCPLEATYQTSWSVFPAALKGPLEVPPSVA